MDRSESVTGPRVWHHETARHVSLRTVLEMYETSSAQCDRLRSLAEAQRVEHNSERAGLVDEHSRAIDRLQATMRSEALDAERERESRHAAALENHAAALSRAREERAEAVSTLKSTQAKTAEAHQAATAELQSLHCGAWIHCVGTYDGSRSRC